MTDEDSALTLTNILTALTDASTVIITLVPEINRIVLDAPYGSITPQQRAGLATHKADLLELAAGLRICCTPADLLAAFRCVRSAGYSIDAVRAVDGRVLWRLWDDACDHLLGLYATEAAARAVAYTANAVAACRYNTAATRRDLISAVRLLACEANESRWFLYPYDTWHTDKLLTEARRLVAALFLIHPTEIEL